MKLVGLLTAHLWTTSLLLDDGATEAETAARPVEFCIRIITDRTHVNVG